MTSPSPAIKPGRTLGGFCGAAGLLAGGACFLAGLHAATLFFLPGAVIANAAELFVSVRKVT